MATVASTTHSHFSRRDLVLFAETNLAASPHFHLSALERRSVTAPCLCSTRRPGDHSDFSSRRAKRSIASSVFCIGLFRDCAFADPRLFRCLFFPLLIRQRPLSIPGEHGTTRTRRCPDLDRERAT